jgi:short subunit dehydrogenase-like uncharacterized protein
MKSSFDLIVFGATGFTGRLVAEYLNATYGVNRDIRWAIAGRSADKLARVRDGIGADAALPILTADAADPAALKRLVQQTKVVLTTVGPYQLHGEPLVTACAEAGTDYVDLCGEPLWMARMIPRLEVPARTSGARIVFSCGFDSIPFDLGVVYLQDEAQRRFGAPLTRVHGRVRKIRGTASGGTIASGMATAEAIGRDRSLAAVLNNPFALTPGFTGPPQADSDSAEYDDWVKSWTVPFVMAPINTKNVHRTNALRGHPWGRDFIYSERRMVGDGKAGAQRARRGARAARVQDVLLRLPPARAFLRRFVLPKPGEGPDARARERGHYDIVFVGAAADGRLLRASVKGDRDPGYGSTAKMISEAALCLALDIDRRKTGGGVWTPGAAMGLALVPRLQQRAGLVFALEGD